MTYQVRLTPEALEDPGQLYAFLLERDLRAAERALSALENAFGMLAYSPFSCRKALNHEESTMARDPDSLRPCWIRRAVRDRG